MSISPTSSYQEYAANYEGGETFDQCLELIQDEILNGEDPFLTYAEIRLGINRCLAVNLVAEGASYYQISPNPLTVPEYLENRGSVYEEGATIIAEDYWQQREMPVRVIFTAYGHEFVLTYLGASAAA